MSAKLTARTRPAGASLQTCTFPADRHSLRSIVFCLLPQRRAIIGVRENEEHRWLYPSFRSAYFCQQVVPAT